jgi:hypothetical protein
MRHTAQCLERRIDLVGVGPTILHDPSDIGWANAPRDRIGVHRVHQRIGLCIVAKESLRGSRFGLTSGLEQSGELVAKLTRDGPQATPPEMSEAVFESQRVKDNPSTSLS